MGVFITRCQVRDPKAMITGDLSEAFQFLDSFRSPLPDTIRPPGGASGQTQGLQRALLEASGFMPRQCFVSANTPMLVFSCRC